MVLSDDDPKVTKSRPLSAMQGTGVLELDHHRSVLRRRCDNRRTCKARAVHLVIDNDKRALLCEPCTEAWLNDDHDAAWFLPLQ